MYTVVMPRRRKKRVDLSGFAKSLVDPTADEALWEKALEEGKNPAAVMLGRLGGLKGGKARAQRLSIEERQAIARRAAEARWKNCRD